ncbi:hypothetical protein [Paraburkholderia bannensis]|uniref:hypothetical protein n=1 Tax=Paraburkholderia bannensis TaxID=765414 RepID=UPI002AB78ACA|nr:hypothetical protein [Paraburkholderia bannensis]
MHYEIEQRGDAAEEAKMCLPELSPHHEGNYDSRSKLVRRLDADEMKVVED